MIWLALAAMCALVALVVVQTRRGRLDDRACCPADPARDLRMRAAFEDQSPDRGA
ncbi:MAG: hypothetical protein U0R80_18135 [Nocardioidaceae bacterium]